MVDGDKRGVTGRGAPEERGEGGSTPRRAGSTSTVSSRAAKRRVTLPGSTTDPSAGDPDATASGASKASHRSTAAGGGPAKGQKRPKRPFYRQSRFWYLIIVIEF